MKYPLRFRLQEWLAERVSWVQYPKQHFIPRNHGAKRPDDWLDKLLRWMMFGYVMWWILAPVLAVIAFFVIASFGELPK